MSCTHRINPLNAELNPICHPLALLGAHHIFHVSGLRVNRSIAHSAAGVRKMSVTPKNTSVFEWN